MWAYERVMPSGALRAISLRRDAHARLTRHMLRVMSVTNRSEKLGNRLLRMAPAEGVQSVRYYGTRVDLDLRDNVQRTLYYRGGYEDSLVRFLLGQLETTDTFVDVGAHIGVFALPVARKLNDGHVIAFEPADDTAAILEANARRGGLGSLTVVRAALGEETGTRSLRLSLQWNPGDLGVRSFHAEGPAVANVPVVRFDDWAHQMSLRRMDIVKIDVEGHELSVLNGMLGSLKEYKPRLVIVEIVAALLGRAGTRPIAVEDFLSALGYEPIGPSIQQVAAGRVGPFWPNAVLRRVAGAAE